ncbi:alpha/beta hydrolase [Streptomyces sp. B6B3]|uniref:alpha/beta hydrolase n=1 Tax=Streptomyces sp. B6B3 TaxID=3153570 RepID=UPI00325C4319
MSMVALVIPGAGYSPARPLLHYARAVLRSHDWTVRELWWQPPDDLAELAPADRAAWVREEVVTAVAAEGGDCGLLVGKSLGSLAADLAADRGLPAVWLTPLLAAEHVVRAVARSTAPTLLVGGTGDGLWDAENARALASRPPVESLELPGADHALELEGDPVRSVAVLQQVVARLDRFVGSLTRRRQGPGGSRQS